MFGRYPRYVVGLSSGGPDAFYKNYDFVAASKAVMETLCRYGMPAKIVVFNNGGIGPGGGDIPDNPMLNMRPNSLIWGARYDLMMQAFGGYGAYVEDPKDLRGALDEAMNFRGPALVNVKLSQGSQRKAQEFRWHS